ncbi:hypothetical protein [Mastigocladopsis repens]|uniref:hypothetical protein n=1 Tax=Mastigocladopsis repens TaxID=221287 RepID=UPI00030AE978|nr:hypothetical protein [Mastigocladopsis repens]
MTEFLETTSQQLVLLSTRPQQNRRQLLRAFWLVALGLFVFELFWTETSSLVTNFGAILITAASLLPSYLWCLGRAQGMPIFPFFSLTFIWTYALPLVSNHPQVVTYSSASHLFASCTTAGFLGLGTFIWFQFVKSAPLLPKSYRALSSHKGKVFFLWVLAAGVLFNMYFVGGWFFLDGGVFAIVRGAILGLNALAAFVLAYLLGTQELSQGQARLFLFLLVANMITNAVGLLLVGTASTFLVATVAFIIGRRKIPVLPILIVLVCLSLLHAGKAEMRAKYWFSGQYTFVQPWEYPTWYAEWAGYSLNYLNQDPESLPDSQRKQSFLERSSVIHLLLLAQDKSPDTTSFLHGETYAILPQILVPRILNPNKIRSHEGTYLLNIHYGLQTREATFTTTIGWGLLAESYANFGLLGCAGLAIVLGVTYGQSTRWSLNMPILSARSLFAVLMMTFAFQTEWTAGVYVAALFQSSVVLGGIVVFLMKFQSLVRMNTELPSPP